MTDADGSGERLVTSPDGWGCPRWSSDGSKLALVEWDLWDVSYGEPNGGPGEVEVVTNDGWESAGETHSCAIWSSDGRRLLLDYSGTLYAVDIATMERTGLADIPLEEPGSNWGPSDWSLDGNRILYDDGYSVVETHPIEKETERLVEPEEESFFRGPRYSPDGREITFTQVCDVGDLYWPKELCVFDLTTREAACLCSGESPVWSPDGRRIAFGDGESNGIKVMNADGSNVEWLVHSPEWLYFRFDWGP